MDLGLSGTNKAPRHFSYIEQGKIIVEYQTFIQRLQVIKLDSQGLAGMRQSSGIGWIANLHIPFDLAMSTFSPTSSELALTSQLFAIADPQNIGIVTGDTAVKILSGAKLSHTVLGEVWAIADKDNNGFLTKKGVAIALRLIGYAQKGEAVTEAMLDKRELQSRYLICFSCLFT